ncbi:ALP1-like protein [Tanacetum coccineum]
MNQNDNDEEGPPNAFEVDNGTDIYFLEQAYAYHKHLQQEENRPRLTRKPFSRDRDGAEERLMGNYFDDYSDANNDINVLDNSPLFDDLLDDKSHVAPFVVNGIGFGKGYYLADEIYPQWANFVKSFTVANDVKHKDQFMAVTDWNDVYANPSRNMQRTWIERSEVQHRKAKELRDRETHISLQQNLMEHIWRDVEDEHEDEHEDEDEDF